MAPDRRTDAGLGSWDILWVDCGPGSESQIRAFLEEDKPPHEVLLTGPCGALVENMRPGMALYANEVLDPRKGPHWPRPPRALSLGAVRRASVGEVLSGKLLTTEAPCVTPSHKLESGHGYGAIGVDLDSALLCRPCVDLDLGHAVVRFVLDPAEVDLTPGSPGVEAALFDGARDCEIALFSLLGRI